jgi:hypothetical protein
MLATAPPLSLAELEANDPQAPPSAGERRFCCPLPSCADKPVDGNHRSLSVNVGTGLWRCYRCNARGKLREYWSAQPVSSRARSHAAVARAFRLTPEPSPPSPEAAPWRDQWTVSKPLAATSGAAYLAGRSIPLAVAEAAGVRWAPAFYGRPAVVFPLTDPDGQLVAVTGRHTDGCDKPKAHTAGPKSLGLFATPGALAAAPLVITEAPLDALALAACGVPAVALCGTTGPRWLPRRAALRPVLLALDNDPAGLEGGVKLGAELYSLGARCEWLRPVRKDWADDLAAVGRDVLAAQLAETLGRTETPPVAPGTPGEPWCSETARALIAALYRRVGAAWHATPPAQRPEAAYRAFAPFDATLWAAYTAQNFYGVRVAIAEYEQAAAVARNSGQ